MFNEKIKEKSAALIINTTSNRRHSKWFHFRSLPHPIIQLRCARFKWKELNGSVCGIRINSFYCSRISLFLSTPRAVFWAICLEKCAFSSLLYGLCTSARAMCECICGQNITGQYCERKTDHFENKYSIGEARENKTIEVCKRDNCQTHNPMKRTCATHKICLNWEVFVVSAGCQEVYTHNKQTNQQNKTEKQKVSCSLKPKFPTHCTPLDIGSGICSKNFIQWTECAFVCLFVYLTQKFSSDFFLVFVREVHEHTVHFARILKINWNNSLWRWKRWNQNDLSHIS